MKTQITFMILLLTWMMKSSLFASNPESSFTLECPPDITVSCTDELWDLSIYGKAYIWEHYKKRDAGPPTKVKRKLNQCGVGEILRIWEVEDPYWNIVTCTQVITVGPKGGFGEKDIIWPESFDTSGCTLDLDPYKLPKKYSIPRFKKVACSKPGYSYTDRVFTVNGSCKKIMRTWEVFDCCVWDPDDPWSKGYWKHRQIIKLIQKDTPTITNCPKKIVVDAKTCDGAFVDLDTVVAIDKCGNKLKVWHNSPYADTSRGPDATGTYPIGTTKFYYIIKYACGRTIKCPVEITVKNNMLPQVYCRNGIITTLMGIDTNGDGVNDEGMVEIWAKDLDKGSTPKCKGKRLWFSFSSDTTDMFRVFTCENVGENEVKIWVTDEFGNQTYCITKVIIQNNAANIVDCMPDSLRPKINHLAGLVAKQDHTPVSKANIRLTDSQGTWLITTTQDTTIVEVRDTFIGKSGNQYVRIHKDTTITEHKDSTFKDVYYTVQSDANGNYSLDSIPKGRTYVLNVEKSGHPMDGIDSRDLLRLLNHLAGIAPFQSPYDFIAADLNGDGLVNQLDYQTLFYALLPISKGNEPFQAWRFVDKHKAVDMSKPLVYTSLESCVFDPLDADHDGIDFVAVKMGDLDQAKTKENIYRENNSRILTLGSIQMLKTGEYLVPVYLNASGKTSGLMHFDWPTNWRKAVSMEAGTAEIEYLYHEETGKISIVWLDPFAHPKQAPLFYLRISSSFTEVKDGMKWLARTLHQDSYCIDDNRDKSSLELRIEDSKESTSKETLAPVVTPNPFQQSVHITFPVQFIGEQCQITTVDLLGKPVHHWSGEATPNGIRLEIPVTASGKLFFCTIQSGKEIYTLKLIRLIP